MIPATITAIITNIKTVSSITLNTNFFLFSGFFRYIITPDKIDIGTAKTPIKNETK